MAKDDIYTYYLTVKATPEVQKEIYLSLYEGEAIGKYLVPDGPSAGRFSFYSFPMKNYCAGNKWPTERLETLLNGIAVRHPDAILIIECYNETDEYESYKKQFHGNLFKEWRFEPTAQMFFPLNKDKEIPFRPFRDRRSR